MIYEARLGKLPVGSCLPDRRVTSTNQNHHLTTGWNSMLIYGEIRSSTESYWRADPKHINETPAKTQEKKTHRKHAMFNPLHTIPFLRMFPNASKGLSIFFGIACLKYRKFTPRISQFPTTMKHLNPFCLILVPYLLPTHHVNRTNKRQVSPPPTHQTFLFR